MHLAAIVVVLLTCNLASRAHDSARLYAYAERNIELSSWRTVFCDYAPVAKLKRGTFFAMTLSPGQHVLSDSKGTPAIVNLPASKPEYVSLAWIYHRRQKGVLTARFED